MLEVSVVTCCFETTGEDKCKVLPPTKAFSRIPPLKELFSNKTERNVVILDVHLLKRDVMLVRLGVSWGESTDHGTNDNYHEELSFTSDGGQTLKERLYAKRKKAALFAVSNPSLVNNPLKYN